MPVSGPSCVFSLRTLRRAWEDGPRPRCAALARHAPARPDGPPPDLRVRCGRLGCACTCGAAGAWAALVFAGSAGRIGVGAFPPPPAWQPESWQPQAWRPQACNLRLGRCGRRVRSAADRSAQLRDAVAAANGGRAGCSATCPAAGGSTAFAWAATGALGSTGRAVAATAGLPWFTEFSSVWSPWAACTMRDLLRRRRDMLSVLGRFLLRGRPCHHAPVPPLKLTPAAVVVVGDLGR